MERRLCSKCRKPRKMDQFINDSTTICHWCRGIYRQRENWTSERREPGSRPRTELSTVVKKKELILQIYETVPCSYCGEDNPDVKVFHHLDPATKYVRQGSNDRQHQSGVSHVLRTLGMDALILELNKCVVLCANCHMLVHKGKIVVTLEDLLRINEKGIVLSPSKP